jgi:hypothetical protein
MVFILVVYYLLHPVRIAGEGTGSPAIFGKLRKTRPYRRSVIPAAGPDRPAKTREKDYGSVIPKN